MSSMQTAPVLNINTIKVLAGALLTTFSDIYNRQHRHNGALPLDHPNNRVFGFVYKFHPFYYDIITGSSYKLILQEAFRCDTAMFDNFTFGTDFYNHGQGDNRKSRFIYITHPDFVKFIEIYKCKYPLNYTISGKFPSSAYNANDPPITQNKLNDIYENIHRSTEITKSNTPAGDNKAYGISIDPNNLPPILKAILSTNASTPSPIWNIVNTAERETEPEPEKEKEKKEKEEEEMKTVEKEKEKEEEEEEDKEDSGVYEENETVKKLGFELLKGNIGSIAEFIRECVSTPTHINPKTSIVDLNIVYGIYTQWFSVKNSTLRSTKLPECFTLEGFKIDFVVLCNKIKCFPHFHVWKCKDVKYRDLISGICIKNPFIHVLYPRKITSCTEEEYDEQIMATQSRKKRKL